MGSRVWSIPAFPTKITEEIQLPTIAELMGTPFLNCVTPEELYEIGNETLIRLFESCHLEGKHKNVYIDSYTQFLHPNFCSINIRTTGEFLHEWHTDGINKAWDEKPTTFHILCSECTGRTEFNVDSKDVVLDDSKSIFELIPFINHHATEWGIKGEKMPSGKFVTFSNHLHNSTTPISRELRFFMRVIETDIDYPKRQGIINTSKTTYLEGKKPVKVDTIVKQGNSVFIKQPLHHLRRKLS
jgi:hypothetical protein